MHAVSILTVWVRFYYHKLPPNVLSTQETSERGSDCPPAHLLLCSLFSSHLLPTAYHPSNALSIGKNAAGGEPTETRW